MAAYLSNKLFLAPLFVILLLLVPSSATLCLQMSGADINAICSKTRNPSFCLKFLNSDPKTATADLPGLARITIDSARASASETLNKLKSLLPQPTDPKLKETYMSCSDNYDDALGSFDDAVKYLVAGDPGSLNIQISAVMDDADTCQEDLKNVRADPSLVQRNDDLENVCSIILVISNMLPH